MTEEEKYNIEQELKGLEEEKEAIKVKLKTLNEISFKDSKKIFQGAIKEILEELKQSERSLDEKIQNLNDILKKSIDQNYWHMNGCVISYGCNT